MKQLQMPLLAVLILVGIPLTGSTQTYSSEGQEFWLGYMENLTLDFNGPPLFALLIDADESGTVTVTAPATGFSFDGSYEAGSSELFFPEGIFYAQGSDETSNFGLRVETTSVASVAAIHYRLYFSDATQLLPTASLSDAYRVMSVEDFDGGSPSQFVVVSTEDNTEVAITPNATTLSLFPAGATFTITLDEGEAYQVQSLGDLSGSLIEAQNGEKLAVFGGAVQADFACTTADNHVWDQVLPWNEADTLFPVIPFSNQDFTTIQILAEQNDTEVYFEDVLQGMLSAGEMIAIETDSPHVIRSNSPVHVSYIKSSQSCSGGIGDPSLLNLLPLGVKTEAATFTSLSTAENGVSFTEHYVSIVAETNGVPGITLDALNIADQFTALPGVSGYLWASVPCTPGVNSLLCPGGCQAWAYGYGDYDAYSYHLDFTAPETSAGLDDRSRSSVVVWPQPASNAINLSVDGRAEITIYNVLGQTLLQTEGVGTFEIDLADYPRGTIVLVVRREAEITRHRVILE